MMDRDIAIVGMAGRFPNARNIDELYVNLRDGKDSIRTISSARLKQTTLPQDKNYNIYGYMEAIDVFDFSLFGISMGEAESMDPHQRQLLEVVYETFENAGYNIDDFNGSNTAVYVGDQMLSYYKHADVFNPTLITGNGSEFLAGRISRFFNLTGAVAMVDTSCSSSLVALHNACNEIILGNADAALVCGVNLELFPFKDETGYHSGTSSPDGTSRPFSATANGMVFGEAVVSVLLKPYQQALIDNDIIHAVIKSSAVNNNANRAASMTAPDALAQAEVIKKAWQKAGVKPTDIGYIEAHGSATQLGDSIEIGGFELAFNADGKAQNNICAISSIKGNIGHCRSAAGIVGLIRAILSLKNQQIFPIPNFDSPSSFISSANSPIYIPSELKTWQVENEATRFAGVSSIGFSGTNVHVVLQESIQKQNHTTITRPEYLIVFSGKTKNALKRNISTFLESISKYSDSDLPNISYTLGIGRKHYSQRFASVVKDLNSLKEICEDFLTSEQIDSQKEINKTIFILSDHQAITDEQLTEIENQSPIFSKYYHQFNLSEETNENIKVFAFQYSAYQVLQELKMLSGQVLGIGIGKIVTDVIAGNLSVEEGIEKVRSYEHTEAQNIASRIEKLVEREVQQAGVVFIELGFEGTLSAALKKHSLYQNKFEVFTFYSERKEGLSHLLSSIYQENKHFEIQKYYCQFEGKRIELPTYQFEKNRCWIRESPRTEEQQQVVFKRDILIEKNVSETARTVADCWQETLELEEPISIYDDFFQVGGDSIKVTKVINQLNKRFNADLSFEDLFDFPTIDSLVKYLESTKTTIEKVTLIWNNILKTETTDVDADFFELGGHSLIANHILNGIRRELSVELDFEDFYCNTTIRQLADCVDNKIAKKQSYKVQQSIPNVPLQVSYQVSNGQKRLWQIGQLKEISVAYNTPNVFKIEGDLKVDMLELALHSVINRHEALRTNFILAGDEIRQLIHESSDIKFKLIFTDLSQEVNPEQAARILIEESIQIPFDFEHDALIRANIYQLSDNQYSLLINIHHIVVDGGSFQVIIKDLFACYSALLQKKNFYYQPLTIQYKDYAAWYNDLLASPEMDIHLDYWLNMFSGELPILDLPMSYPRPSLKTYNGKRIIRDLSANMSKNLKQFNQKQSVSTFTSILAILKILLARYSGQQDIIVGYPSAGRFHQDLENQVGYYASTIALRTILSDEISFSDLLQVLKNQTVEANKHQMFPFDDLLESINLKRDLSRSPLFDVMLAMQNLEEAQNDSFSIEGINISGFETELKSSKLDLLFSVFEKKDKFTICLDYNTDLFSETYINQLFHHLEGIIEAAIQNPNKSVFELEYLDKNETSFLLNKTEQNESLYNNSTIVSLFESQVKETPEAIALLFGEEQLSYRALNERANQLAHYLQNQGVGVGTLVSLCLERSIEIVISLLGILKSGGVYIPLDPTHPSERLGYFLADSQSKYLLTTPQSAKNLPSNYGGKTFYLDELTDILVSYSDENLGIDLHPSDLAYIIYTSGSTGRPKGVMLAHAGVVNRIAWQWKHYNFTLSDVILQKTTYCFDVSVWEFFMTLCYGAKLVLCTTEAVYNPLILSELISRHCITTLHFVPSMYRAFLSHLSTSDFKNLSSLRHVLLSGEALSSDLVGEHYKHLEIPMHNLYGPTEASVDVSYYEVQATDSQRISVPIGKAIANTQLYILDKHQQLVPEGITGELYLGGIGLAKGYLNRAELTAERFIDNPFKEFLGEVGAKSEKLYRTGDLAKWDTEGNVLYLGRVDFQVKVRGYRIELGEIEHQLQHYAGINQAVVLAQMDEEQNPYLVAYIEMGEGEEMSQTSELRTYLRKTLPDYMLPDYYVQVREWVLNSNGKLDRQSLSKPHLQNREEKTGGDLAISETTIGKELSVLWSEVLGQDLDSLKMNSHFFEMGGHSLKALRLVSRLHERLGIRIGVDVVFMNPVFGDLLKVLEGQKMDEFLEIPLVFNSENHYALSNSQRRLWVLDQIGAGSSYHIFSSFKVEGLLEKSYLLQALNYLINRHEILRTRFLVINGVPQQQVLSVEECEFEVELKTANEKVFIDNYINKPFDLAKDNLIRVCLLEQPSGESKLIFVMHHIISDGWSLDVFIQELSECYEQILNGQTPDLPSLRIQYKDYAAWSNNRLADAWAMEAKNYWQELFKGDLPVFNLPTDYARPLTKTYRGGVVNRIISKDLFTKFTNTEGQKGASNFIKIQAVLGILLHRYTGQDDIVVGTPVAGRGEAELDAQIGFYVNLLALRNSIEASESYSTILERIRINTVNGYAYQDYPFDQLIEDLQLSRDTSRNPLFDVLLNYQHFSDKSSIVLGNAVLSEYPSDTTTCKYDLEFSCQETPDGLHILLNYNTDIFIEKSVERLLFHLENIIGAVVEHPTEKIGALAYLGTDETRQLTESFNQTQRTYNPQETLVSMFENQVSKTPDAVALISHNETLTYQELNQRANQVAYYLRNGKGIYPEQVVALLADRGWELVVGILGIWKSGGVYLPLDTNHPVERLAYLLEDSNAKLVLSQGSFAEIFSTFNSQNYALIEDILSNTKDDICNNNWPHSSQHLAYLLYTSGSTGKPKGVLIRHQNVCNFLHSMSECLQINQSDKWASINNYAFDIFMLELMLPLTQGAKVLIVANGIIRSPHELRQLLVQQKVTFLQATPTMWGLILDDDFTYLKIITAVCGGEPMGEHLGKKLLKTTQKLWNVYGPTETTIWSTIKLIENENDLGTIGKPIANTQIYILDNQQNLVPSGVVGEICIGGNGLARGYLNRSDLTSEKFLPNPFTKTGRVYRTGDLGRWLPNGELECLGRTDSQVKLRGYRIELPEIEYVIEQHPAVVQSVVMVQNDASNNKALVAYVRSEEDLESAVLREFAKGFLPDYMVPSYFICLREFPKTPNGKLDKKQLPQPDFSQNSQKAVYEKPENLREEMLSSIWEIVLNKQQVGRNDNFFDVGGDSLKAIQVVSRVYEAGYKITVMALFNNPVLKNLVALLTETEQNEMEMSAWAKASKIKKESKSNDDLLTFSNTKIDFGKGNNLSFQYTLPTHETGQLIKQVNEPYATETADILLTVLGICINETFDIQQVMVDLVVEEKMLLANSGSLQNHHFPMLLTTNYSHQWERQIKETKEQIRQGLGEIISSEIENIKPQIGFRYGQNLEMGLMEYMPQIMLEITRTDDCLEINFHFSDCNAQEAFAFQENYALILKEIIAFCTNQTTQELSPSDLGYSQLSVDELENFFN